MTAQPFFELWVYLAATPLAGLTLTLVMYVAGSCTRFRSPIRFSLRSR
jgi:hypothetical protein